MSAVLTKWRPRIGCTSRGFRWSVVRRRPTSSWGWERCRRPATRRSFPAAPDTWCSRALAADLTLRREQESRCFSDQQKAPFQVLISQFRLHDDANTTTWNYREKNPHRSNRTSWSFKYIYWRHTLFRRSVLFSSLPFYSWTKALVNNDKIFLNCH